MSIFCYTNNTYSFSKACALDLKISLTLLCFHLLVPTAPFLYPLKTSENLTVFCFQVVEKGCSGNEWVNRRPIYLKIMDDFASSLCFHDRSRKLTTGYDFKLFKFIVFLLLVCFHSALSRDLAYTEIFFFPKIFYLKMSVTNFCVKEEI